MSAPSPGRRFLLLAVLALVLGTGYALLLKRMYPTGSADAASSGPVLAAASDAPDAFSDVAPFTLVRSDGRTITRDDLLGTPWVVGFVFTRCTGPCPKITANMGELQSQLADTAARIVTITVDPAFDTPEVLSGYARDHRADPGRWWFLTGAPDDVQRLSEQSFRLPIARDDTQPVGSSVTHKTWLTVVDARGRVRGYYNGETPEGVARAAARARFLLTEK